MSDYRTYVTQTGFGLERDAKFNSTSVDFAVLVVGDGVLPDAESPATQTDLIHQVREYAITIEKDDKDLNVWIARAEIPAADGGFTIREAGIKTESGELYAYARQAGDYKPLLEEGQGKSYTIRLKFVPGNADTIQVKIDPSVQFATPTDLNNAVVAHVNENDPHEQYQTKVAAETQAKADKVYADSLQSKKKTFIVSGTANEVVLTSKEGTTPITELNDFDEFSFVVATTNTDVMTIKVDDLEAVPLMGVVSDTQVIVTALLTVRFIAGAFYIAEQVNPRTGNPVSLIGELLTSTFAHTGACKMRFDSGELDRNVHPILLAKAKKDGLIDQVTKDSNLKIYGGFWGDGDGSTTFTTPIYGGLVVRFTDRGRGIDSGRVFGSYQDDQIKAHRHEIARTTAGKYDGSNDPDDTVTSGTGLGTTYFGGSETRSKNIAKDAEFLV